LPAPPRRRIACRPAPEAARDKALTDKTAWNVLESLTTEVGPRPVGTPAMERARDWGVAKLKELGFQNVKVETFTTPTWTRVGDDTAEVLSPYPQKLHILALGRSASTPPGGLTGEIKLFKNYQEFLDAPVGSLKGKIAVVTQVMAKTQDISGYANINMQRGQGATEAAKRGAIGYMMRSLSTDDTRLPHTGGGADAGIPSVALSKPRRRPAGAYRGARQAGDGADQRAIDPQPGLDRFNVSGEIPGTTDELVILGGHLDSWDPGTGAIDDGSGIAISTAAAKMATANGGKPRRTIRVVMWGSEEQGGASAAYAKAHEAELPKIVVVGESDDGPDSIYDVSIPKGGDAHPAMKAFRIATSTLGVVADRIPATDGGADVSAMVRAGAPVVEFRNSVLRYMDLHHSADDTLDKVDPRTLNQNVAVWASFLHTVAYSDIDFRKLATDAPEVTGSARSRNR
jgi:hypothetical protein